MMTLTDGCFANREKWYPENVGIFLKDAYFDCVNMTAAGTFFNNCFFCHFFSPCAVNEHDGG